VPLLFATHPQQWMGGYDLGLNFVIVTISKMFSNFELEMFVSGSIALGFGCFPNTVATLEHSEVIFHGGDSLGVSKPWFLGQILNTNCHFDIGFQIMGGWSKSVDWTLGVH